MKRLFISLTAIVGAITASSFTANIAPPDDVWFLTNATGTPRSELLPTIDKPSCPNFSVTICARKYTSYQIIPGSGGNPTTYTPGTYLGIQTFKAQ